MEASAAAQGDAQKKNETNDYIIKLLIMVADDWWLLGMAITFFGLAASGLQLVMIPFRDDFPQLKLLDARVSGYTYAEFNAFYDILGVKGCQQYLELCQWDVYPFCVSYVICIGVMLVQTARWNGRDLRMAYMAIVMGIADLIETLIQRYGCIVLLRSSPEEGDDVKVNVVRERIPEYMVEIASAAVQVKWILVSLSLGSVVVGTMRAIHIGKVKLWPMSLFGKKKQE